MVSLGQTHTLYKEAMLPAVISFSRWNEPAYQPLEVLPLLQ